MHQTGNPRENRQAPGLAGRGTGSPANADNAFAISGADSWIAIHVVATNEEQLISDETLAIIGLN